MSPSLRMRTVVLAVVAVSSQASLASMTAGKPKSAISMLEEVEEQARSGKRPAFNVVQDIIGIIETIKTELVATRAQAVKDIEGFHVAVPTCTTTSTLRIAQITRDVLPDVVTDRTTHKDCRDAENLAVAADHTARDATCELRDTFLAATISASKGEKPASSSREDKVSYVQAMSELYCDGDTEGGTKGTEAAGKDSACSKAKEDLETELATHKKKCRQSQAAFENAFCTWRDEVVRNCNEYESCYNSAKDAYNNAKEEMFGEDGKVAKWKDELKAVEKILCYCKVWQGTTDSDQDETGANRSSINAAQPGQCSTLKPDTTEMDVRDLGDVAEYQECESVSDYPGTDEFTQKEYAPINNENRGLHGIDDVKKMITCIGEVEDTDTWHKDWHSGWQADNPALAEGSVSQDNTRKRPSPQKPISALQLDSQGGYAPISTRSDLEDMEMNDLVGKMNELMGHINSPGTSVKDMKAALAQSIESLQHAL